MSQNRAFANRKVMSGAVPWGGGDAPMAASAKKDSPRLHMIMTGLAMRAADRMEEIGNPQP